jgi:REP element-mobilizing transposase RayT
MPRRPRIHYPGAVYHVTARGVEKRTIFFDSEDFNRYATTQARTISMFGARLIAYCLMPNHTHLAIEVGSIPLSRIMHRILGLTALSFNDKYQRVGHLFQGRHSAYLVTHERYLQNLVRYIHQNPVRAKLVQRPKDWAWSSCTDDPQEEEALPADFDPYFGTPNEEDSLLIRKAPPARETLDDIGNMIRAKTAVSIEEIRWGGKRRPAVAARIAFSISAAAAGYTITETANWLGLSGTAVSNYLSSR